MTESEIDGPSGEMTMSSTEKLSSEIAAALLADDLVLPGDIDLLTRNLKTGTMKSTGWELMISKAMELKKRERPENQ